MIETMQVVAWFHSVAMEAECKQTAYAVEQRFDALRIERVPISEDWPAIQWQRYADGGVTPSDETVQRVEQVLPTTRDTFITGPKSESGVAPLWLALGGPLEGVRSVLNWYDERLWELHLAGAPFERMMYAVTDAVFPRELLQEFLPKWELDVKRNPVAYAIDKGHVEIEMDRFVVLVALFRISMETGAAFPMMDMVMTGLLHKAVYDLFDEWGIARHVKTYLEVIRDQHREAIVKGFEALQNKQASRSTRH
ncbi:TPA: hypothetical protein QDB31_005458 [Burkholderia vietnamiensis]|nr:hypothetical protein [Burkholderia vietnamiensis]